MDIINFGYQLKTPMVMCLGYFDAIHIGHTGLINKAKDIAKNENLSLSVLLFTGGKGESKDVFSLEERLIKLRVLGVETVIIATLDNSFMNKTKDEFLNELFTLYNVKYTACGYDFRYGKNAGGDLKFLENFAKKIGAKTIFCPEITDKTGQKISSKTIKKALLDGNILLANELIGSNYFIRGTVIKGKELGRKIGYPTANILINNEKLLIKSGVYLTFTIIGDKIYSCLTNVGKQPTVNGFSDVVETYIYNYNGDLYGKSLTVYFVEKIRDISKFSSIEELKNQLDKDLEVLK